MALTFGLYNPTRPSSGRNTRPPFAYFGMAQQAEKHGAKSLIVDSPRTTSDGIDQLRRQAPQLVGISTFYRDQCFGLELEVGQAMRTSGAKIILGGHDVSSCQERRTWAAEAIKPDFMVIGPGEIPVGELIKAGLDPKKIDQSKVSATKDKETGIWTLQARGVARYQLEELALPTQMPTIYPQRTSWAQGIIEIARGCIGECNFCGGAKMPLTYMKPTTVIEHIKAWLSLKQGQIDLMAPDFTANPRFANNLIKEINKHPDLGVLSLFFSVRVDTMAKAIDLDRNAWLQFLSNHEALLEVGIETFYERKLAADWLNKSRSPDQHFANVRKILQLVQEANESKEGQPKSIVTGDYITFDPWTRLEVAHHDYVTQWGLAKEFPHLSVTDTAWAKEIIPYPGSQTAARFAVKRSGPHGNRYKLKGYADKRTEALLSTLKMHRQDFEPKEGQPITSSLERIAALASMMLRKFTDPHKPVNLSVVDESLLPILEAQRQNLASLIIPSVIQS